MSVVVIRAAAMLSAAVLLLASASVASGSTPDLMVSSRAYERINGQPVEAGFAFTRAATPARTIVTDREGAWVATFTDGARTVTISGPTRRFSEPTASHAVTTSTWVRLLPRPFDGTVDRVWLTAARRDRSDDVLAVLMQFLPGAPDVHDAAGLLIAGEAHYGPEREDAFRPIGSDWNDYQGVTALYPGGQVERPEADRYRSLDCSGYIRMVFGRRLGVPLSLREDGGASLPRTSRVQASHGPGRVLIPDRGEQVTGFGHLAAGDLVFHDTSSNGTIDHVGVYLGVDEGGRRRFVSSRRSVNGPTMGDRNGWSVLDGSGLFARSFRTARRL